MQTNRIFRYYDAQLIEIARTMQKHFNTHEGGFLEFDSTMSRSWLQDLVDAAWEARIDDFERGYIRDNTDLVVQQMEECGRVFRKARYFIRKAYDKDDVRREQFRLKTFRRVRFSQSRLIYYMNTFCKRVEDHRDVLTAQGASEQFFTDLMQASERMAEYNDEQETSKTLRKAFTKERIGTMNALYKGLRQIEEVAGFVFDEDSKEIDLFSMPVMNTSSRGSDTEAAAIPEQVTDESNPSADSPETVE